MTPEHTTDSKLEDRLCEILAEFVEEADRGGVPDEEAYLARYPEFADDLRRCFANYKKFPPPSGDKAELALAGDGVTGEASGAAPPETLGDFRIVREIGRGGMGVVYEAEQLSLRRRVALKVLPLAATMDPRQLQRFHNEARAAACLHHTNIVPVFAVGSERGVHFYAMQLIDGVTLAAAIRELRPGQNEPGALEIVQL
jgi:serine/threonine protein kinase